MDRMLQILTIGFTAVNTMRTVAYIDDLNERKANTLVPQACHHVYDTFVKDIRIERKLTPDEKSIALNYALSYVNDRTNFILYGDTYLKFKIEDRLRQIKNEKKK